MRTNRTNQICIRLTTIEFEKLNKLSNKANMFHSEFFRAMLKDSIVKAKLNPIELNILQQLIGMATNLNQLAHHANAKMDFKRLAEKIESRLQSIDQIILNLNLNDR